MNKILIVFDGTNVSQGAFEFARRLNELEPILLVGAFLPQTDLSESWSYNAGERPLHIPAVEPSVSETVAENMLQFEAFCKSNDIDFRIHEHFHQLAMQELLKETRFAHLLIVGSEKFFGGDTACLTDLLHDAECPVLVVPEEFNPPEQLVLAYDGSRASVFAIRQFCFLFPGLCGLPATLVYAGPANDKDGSLPEEPYVEELVAGLFSNLNIRHLELAPGTGFAAWLSGLPAPLLISGSFGRSLLSQVFRESFA
ncbi:Nucleotide-binding universal stress protein, UspA family [Chitinophaga rupis]|uniref:Nucleotide-binding universal stress protein, UspA family n=1 Tax=Chitinophaga rupis TaxID=573321 RepID=A0A1H7Q1B9_9BACT|nr:universal stress protein [Chitinophaga rupis]SEL41275.1 Nucleotide-binding universal stress protein, UspA family [Chitinophaga rupis]